jgi:hypothetical protein
MTQSGIKLTKDGIMKLTKGVISRSEAVKLAPDYVKFIESKGLEHFDLWGTQINPKFEKLKRRQKCLTFLNGQYIKVEVCSIIHDDIRAVDGPIVRVGNGEYSWRVDGAHYAWPL